jgi:hypothetical protein
MKESVRFVRHSIVRCARLVSFFFFFFINAQSQAGLRVGVSASCYSRLEKPSDYVLPIAPIQSCEMLNHILQSMLLRHHRFWAHPQISGVSCGQKGNNSTHRYSPQPHSLHCCGGETHSALFSVLSLPTDGQATFRCKAQYLQQ